MWWFWLTLACSFGPSDGLGAEGRAAQDALAQALVDRNVAAVTAAAQTASTWEGKNPDLDRLLGDALANVLMRPEPGLALLEAHPAVGDPVWEKAILDAAMRLGQIGRIEEIRAQLGRPALDYDHPVLGQVALRAVSDASMSHAVLDEAIQNCRLLDGQPRIGRQSLDLPATPKLIHAAHALGATRVVVGRAVRRTDVDPGMGRGPLHCVSGVLLPPVWPDQPVRSFTVGATDGNTQLYLNIKLEDSAPWAFAASDANSGARWLNAAMMLSTIGHAPDAAEQVRARFGEGLRETR